MKSITYFVSYIYLTYTFIHLVLLWYRNFCISGNGTINYNNVLIGREGLKSPLGMKLGQKSRVFTDNPIDIQSYFLPLNFWLHLLIYLCVCAMYMYVQACVPVPMEQGCICHSANRGQRANSTMWVPGTELRASGLVAKPLLAVILLPPLSNFLKIVCLLM